MYSSVKDVKFALAPGGVPGDNNLSAVTLPDEQIADSIHEADALINSYLSFGYKVSTVVTEDEGETVTTAIAPFRWLSRDIAAYLATLVWRQSRDLDVDDPIRLRYATAMAFLERIREGSATLPPSDGETDPYISGVAVVNLYDRVLFPRADLVSEYDYWVPPQVWYSGGTHG